MPTPDANCETVRRFIDEIWNDGRGDALADYVTDDFADTAYSPANAQGHRAMVERLKGVLPDASWRIDRLVGAGDEVVAELTLTGTHRGVFAGVEPRGNRVSVRCYRSFEFRDGKVARHAALLDTHGLLQQMQAKDAPA